MSGPPSTDAGSHNARDKADFGREGLRRLLELNHAKIAEPMSKLRCLQEADEPPVWLITFVLNFAREAKRYAERYPADPLGAHYVQAAAAFGLEVRLESR